MASQEAQGARAACATRLSRESRSQPATEQTRFTSGAAALTLRSRTTIITGGPTLQAGRGEGGGGDVVSAAKEQAMALVPSWSLEGAKPAGKLRQQGKLVSPNAVRCLLASAPT